MTSYARTQSPSNTPPATRQDAATATPSSRPATVGPTATTGAPAALPTQNHQLPESASSQRQPLSVWVLAFAAMVSFMGIGLVDPILKPIAANLGATPSQVSLLFTSYLLVTAFAMLITSFASSRLGGRTTLMLGLGIIIVFSTLAGTSDSVAALVGWRAGWGLGNALFIATALAAIIAVARGGAEKAITLYEAALGIGLSVGPLVGAVLGGWNWRAPFFGVATLMAIALVAIALFLKDKVKISHNIRPADPIRALSHGGLLVLGIAALLYNGGFFAVLAFTPFVVPFGAYGIGFLFFGWGVLVGIFAVWGAPWLRTRLGLVNAFALAFGLFTVILVVMATNVHHSGVIATCVVLCGIPLGVLNTLFTETAMNVAPVPRPVASAGYNFVRFLGGALSPWICGKLGENVSEAAPFWFGAICVAVGLGVLVLLGRRYLTKVALAH
jgi:predicted MFS family arabinose efflux permease